MGLANGIFPCYRIEFRTLGISILISNMKPPRLIIIRENEPFYCKFILEPSGIRERGTVKPMRQMERSHKIFGPCQKFPETDSFWLSR